MGIQVALNHRTHYRYEKEIFLGPQVMRLRPAPHCRVPILSYSLDITPSEHLLNWQMDPHSDRLARLLFPKKTDEFLIDVNLVADLSPINPFEFFLEPGVEEYPFTYPLGLARDLEPFRSVDPPGPLSGFLAQFRGEKCGLVLRSDHPKKRRAHLESTP
jgi:transglutaminase-like putative cysteine protease